MRGKNWDLNPRLHFLYCPDSTVGVQRRLLVGGGEELRHALWMCWVGGAHETSRRRVEFGGWGRSNSTEKEFVSGSYILTSAYWEPQFRSTLWWNFQTAILAAHQQGCSEVCAWFSRPIFRSCSQGLFFFFLTCFRSSLLHMYSQCCLHFSEGTLQLVVLWLTAEMCLCEVLSCVALGGTSASGSATLEVMKTSFCGRSWRWWACSPGGGRTRGKQADLVAQESSCTLG